MEKEKLNDKNNYTLEKLSKLWPELDPVTKAYFIGKADGFTEAEMLARQKALAFLNPKPTQPRA